MSVAAAKSNVKFVRYSTEEQLPALQRLIDSTLSEPYSVYTFRYFLNNWPDLTILAMVPPPESESSEWDQGEEEEEEEKVKAKASSNNSNNNIITAVKATETTPKEKKLPYVYDTPVKGRCIGVVICKLAEDQSERLTPPPDALRQPAARRGYLAMLSVDPEFRKLRLGTTLVNLGVDALRRKKCDVVVLETEVTNHASLRLYESLGFVRETRLVRYYLNGSDAFQQKKWLTPLPPFVYPELPVAAAAAAAAAAVQ